MDYIDNEEELIDEMSEGTMTYVEYIDQHDRSYRDEYREYCKDNHLDTNDEEAAMEFIEYKEDEMDANMDN